MASYEQYGQMWRNLKRGIPVKMDLNAQNRWVTDDSLGYNTLAEWPGTDKADEYVMFGGHLDSWRGPPTRWPIATTCSRGSCLCSVRRRDHWRVHHLAP